MTFLTKELQTHWTTIAPLLTIRNERDRWQRGRQTTQ